MSHRSTMIPLLTWEITEFVASMLDDPDNYPPDNYKGADGAEHEGPPLFHGWTPLDLIAKAKELVQSRDRLLGEKFPSRPTFTSADTDWIASCGFTTQEIAAYRITTALEEHALPTLNAEFFREQLHIDPPPPENGAIHWLICREMSHLSIEAQLLHEEARAELEKRDG